MVHENSTAGDCKHTPPTLTPTPTVQPELPGIDSDRHAVETRLAAMQRERNSKLVLILQLVRSAGYVGRTRDEISLALPCPIQSVTSPVLALVRDGELVETPARRNTRWGSPAVVLVHVTFDQWREHDEADAIDAPLIAM